MKRVGLAGLLAACFVACGTTGDAARPVGEERAAAPSESDVADASSEAATPADAAAEDGGSRLEDSPPMEAWPRLVPGLQARAVTSYDRTGGNDDGFGGTYSSLGKDADGSTVILDEAGPGVLRTLWFTSAIDGDSALGLGKIRLYLDDASSPSIEIDSDVLFGGRTAPFLAPLVDANHSTSGGSASWLPIAYRSRLRITTEHPAGFYAAHFDVLPPDTEIGAGSADAGLSGAAKSLALAFAATGPSKLPLTKVPLDVVRTGSGAIDVLRFVPDAPLDDDALAAAHLQITFDGAATPQVDVPLGVFFGSGRGLAPIDAVPWTMRPTLLESRLPMPFWESVHITITGIAGEAFLHVTEPRWPRAETGTLEVHYRPSSATTAAEDVVYADVTGAGKLVATVLAVDPETASTKRWWEGDLRVLVDGARTPAIHGTGHEDDHLGGWSNEFLSRPFTLPMQGCPRTDLLDTGGEFQKNGATTMYRIWPGIPFQNALRQTTEHGSSNSVATRYLAAAFLYRRATARTTRAGSFHVAAGRSVTSAFEGEDATALTHFVTDHTTALECDLTIPTENAGVMLRRLADRHEAPASARLEVDGVVVAHARTTGPLAEARAWFDRDFFVPARFTAGKSKIRVRWVPESGTSRTASFEAWPVAVE